VSRLAAWLGSVASGKVALVATVGFLLFVVIVLPAQGSVTGRGGEEVRSPDLSFWYSADTLYDIAESYGEEGRAEYVRARVTFDVVWPIVYVTFLALTLAWVGRRLDGRFWPRTGLLPLAAGAFDYLENAATVVAMLSFPERATAALWLAPVFTVLKWSLLGASFVLLGVGAVLVVWRALFGRDGEQS
jgi:hypothetical protein